MDRAPIGEAHGGCCRSRGYRGRGGAVHGTAVAGRPKRTQRRAVRPMNAPLLLQHHLLLVQRRLCLRPSAGWQAQQQRSASRVLRRLALRGAVSGWAGAQVTRCESARGVHRGAVCSPCCAVELGYMDGQGYGSRMVAVRDRSYVFLVLATTRRDSRAKCHHTQDDDDDGDECSQDGSGW